MISQLIFGKKVLFACLWILGIGMCPGAVFISEFVARGNVTFLDEDGESPDWIEIFNGGSSVVDLGGFGISDDVANPMKWVLPSRSLGAGEYLVIFASGKDRRGAVGNLHTNFKLSGGGEYLGLSAPGGVLSEFAPMYPVQQDGSSYGVEGVLRDGRRGFFGVPTPGQTNGNLSGVGSPEITVSPKCGTFVNEVEVRVSLPEGSEGFELRYTLDGSVPTVNSSLVPEVVKIGETARLRVRAFEQASGLGGGVREGVYVRLAAGSNFGGLVSPGEFVSEVPIVVVESFGRGEVPREREYQENWALVFEVDPLTGQSRMLGEASDCYRMGMRGRGQSSRYFEKGQYRVEVWDDQGRDLKVPFLGLPAEADWVFSAPWIDKSLVRNPFVFGLGKELGMMVPRSKSFEMFLNESGGAVDSRDYVGVYHLFEKIERGSQRVDIEKLDSSVVSGEDLTGGYLMRMEPVDVVGEAPKALGWNSIEVLEPKAPVSAQLSYLGRYLDNFYATLGGTRGQGAVGVVNADPVSGYPAFIDVDSFVNLVVINELVRDQDSYVRSNYLFKERGGKLVQGPLWDYNLSMGTGGFFENTSVSGWQYEQDYNRGMEWDDGFDGEADWIFPLMNEVNFRQRVIDRWVDLRRRGILREDRLLGSLDELVAELGGAGGRNFVRWDILAEGLSFESPLVGTWDGQVGFMKDWLRRRIDWIEGQFVEVPILSPGLGAKVAVGDEVMVSPGGRVFYTLNGDDPRLAGGGVRPGALEIGGDWQFAVGSGTFRLKMRRLAANGEWSGLVDGVYVVGEPAVVGGLVVTELNYHPVGPTEAEQAANMEWTESDFEWLEVRNVSESEMDLSGVRFVEGIEFEFPVGSVLEAGGFGVVVANRLAFEMRYGSGVRVFGEYRGKLDNDGEELILRSADDGVLSGFVYNDVWYRESDGAGRTLRLCANGEGVVDQGQVGVWTSSSVDAGTPGAGDVECLTYGLWTSAYEGVSASGPLGDVDGDGWTNLEEYAFGTDPLVVGGESGMKIVPRENGGSRFQFLRRVGVEDLIWEIEESGDLVNWTRVTVDLVGDGSARADERELVVLEVGGGLALKKFVRVRVGLRN